jgi:hypothetical protein
MSTTRRRLSATLLPLLALAAGTGSAAAKTAGPIGAEACVPGDASRRCAAAKTHFVADGAEEEAGCPFCARGTGGKDAAPDLFRKRGAV